MPHVHTHASWTVSVDGTDSMTWYEWFSDISQTDDQPLDWETVPGTSP